MYTLKLEHGFAAAHKLEHAYSEECNNYTHGHNWKVIVTIQTNELKNGMVLDFKKIKEIINKLDHRDLNSILTFEPTAENIAKHLYEEITIAAMIKERLCLVEVEVFEADKASVKYSI